MNDTLISLQCPIQRSLHAEAKARAALLSMTLAKYIERLIERDVDMRLVEAVRREQEQESNVHWHEQKEINR